MADRDYKFATWIPGTAAGMVFGVGQVERDPDLIPGSF